MRAASLCLVILIAGCAAPVEGPQLAILEPKPSPFAVFETTMHTYLEEKGIRAGSMAVSEGRRVLWASGFGSMSADQYEPVPQDAMFRLASVVKPITAAVVESLVRQGALRRSDPLFCVEPVPEARCHLRIEPPSGKFADPRVRLITIQHAMEHRGGWDRSLSGDPMFMSRTIATEMGVTSPPDQLTIARWMMGRLLDHVPGTVYAYSNFGYMLLGLLVEQLIRGDYTHYVQEKIFPPLYRHEVQLARTFPDDRSALEPAYACRGKAPSVFPPHERVCWPDGAWYLEAMEANGGLVASSRAVAWFLTAYWISGQPRDVAPGYSYTFFGSLDGTYTMARQRPDGLNLVVLLNDRLDRQRSSLTDLYAVFEEAADAYRAAETRSTAG